MKKDKNSLYYKAHQLLNCGDIDVYVDMDGVLAEYKYGEGTKILTGDTAVYFQKRPIKTIIKFIRKYFKRNNFYILTSCIKENQIVAKKEWVKKYLPFFNQDNMVCIVSEDFESRINDKVNYISQKINSRNKKSILIEDTHEILKKSWEQNKELLLPVLVINLIK